MTDRIPPPNGGGGRGGYHCLCSQESPKSDGGGGEGRHPETDQWHSAEINQSILLFLGQYVIGTCSFSVCFVNLIDCFMPSADKYNTYEYLYFYI